MRGGDLRLRIAVGSLPMRRRAAGREHRGQRRLPDRGRIRCRALRGRRLQRNPVADHAGRRWPSARAVNLERAMLPTDRLGGHLVSGPCRRRRPACENDLGRRRARSAGASTRRRPLLRYIAAKGSICVDGVSLTVNDVDDAGFEVEPGSAHGRAHRVRAARRSATRSTWKSTWSRATSSGCCSRHRLREIERMSFATIPELLEEIRAGRMVVIVDDEDRENEGDLIMAAELVRPSDINFMVTHARGLVCLSLTRERCRQLGLPPMVRDNTSPLPAPTSPSASRPPKASPPASPPTTARTPSAPRCVPMRAAATSTQPGHIFPLMAQPGGVLDARRPHRSGERPRAARRAWSRPACWSRSCNADGGMARRPELEVFAREHGLKIGSIEDLIRYRLATEHTIERVDERDIDTDARPVPPASPIATASAASCISRWCAAQPTPDVPTLVRVHVQNPLSDVLHWRRAGFRPQRSATRWPRSPRRLRRGGGAVRSADARTTCSRASASSRSADAAPSVGRMAPQRRRRADPGRPGPGQAARARHAAPAGRAWPATAWKSSNTCAGRPIRHAQALNCHAHSRNPDHAPIRRRPARRCQAPASPSSPAAGTRASPMRWSTARAQALHRQRRGRGRGRRVRVPGAWELPVAAARWRRSGTHVAHRRAGLRDPRRHPPLRTGRRWLRATA